MNQPNNYLLLYANCIPVRGAKRSLICDLQRQAYFYIPNALHDMLESSRQKPVSELLSDYPGQESIIEEYFSFIQSHDLGFFTDTPELFPDIDFQWKSPCIISNCIIDVLPSSRHSWQHIVQELETVMCRDLVVRFYEETGDDEIESLLQALENSQIKSIELILKYKKSYSVRKLQSLTTTYFRIRSIFVHSSDKDWLAVMKDAHFLEDGIGMGSIIYVTQRIDSASHCGIISPLYFTLNIRSFTEARNYNSCLYAKVGIDVDGAIKNCPSMQKSYGNIKTDRLKDVVVREAFLESGNITKDQVSVCNDCEHRYICTDCRAYTTGGESHGKPAKCRYDPYTAEWSAPATTKG